MTNMNLDDFVNKPKEIFIKRSQGGIGDILNTRMLFKDLKKVTGGMKISYAIPEIYISLLIDHPYVDELIPCETFSPQRHSFVKDITNKAGEYESQVIPNVDKHRSDAWAHYIGFGITDHDMHIGFYKEELKFADKKLKKFKGMKVAIQPVSNHKSKDWEMDKWQKLVDAIKDKYKCEIICFHNSPLPLKNVVQMNDLSLREWMVMVYKCDYVITIASSMFCLANGLHKPTVAIFGCENLDTYGKYFSEMIPIQRHRKHGSDNGAWKECPCWNGWNYCIKEKVRFSKAEQFPPVCLKDIPVEETLEGFKKCLSLKR